MLAMEKFVADLECDASTVQCWDSLENNYGCAACLGMSLIGEKGKPSACESDVTGAASMLIAKLAAGSPPALMDWNKNVDENDDACITLHCSNFPKSFFGTEKWKSAAWMCLAACSAKKTLLARARLRSRKAP